MHLLSPTKKEKILIDIGILDISLIQLLSYPKRQNTLTTEANTDRNKRNTSITKHIKIYTYMYIHTHFHLYDE